MKHIALILLLAVAPVARGQWSAGVSAGLAFPLPNGASVPELRTSFAASLQGWYRLSPRHPWQLTASLDAVRWMGSVAAPGSDLPLDKELRAVRYLFFPLTAGLSCRWPVAGWLSFDAFLAVGGYWRELNCMQRRDPVSLYDIEEHGLGFALKASLAAFLFHDRLSLSLSFLSLGNPFSTAPPTLLSPLSTLRSPSSDRYRSQTTAEDYHQFFLNLCIGWNISQ